MASTSTTEKDTPARAEEGSYAGMKENAIIQLGKGLTLYGWSMGSVSTGFFIPELRLLLDTERRKPFEAEFVLVTHSHTDHIFGLPHRIMGANPLVFIPQESEQLVRDFVLATFRMGFHDSKAEIKLNLRGVKPGQHHVLKNGFCAEVFDLDHSIPCRGYGIYEARTKLREKYRMLDRKAIIALKSAGCSDLFEDIAYPRFAYLTDTTTTVFAKYGEEIFRYPYIITECTFLPCKTGTTEESAECDALAEKARHTSWGKIQPIIDSHPKNTFILMHFSQRYSRADLCTFRDATMETLKNIVFVI